MTKILLCGCLGAMGQAITRVAAASSDCEITCGFDVAMNENSGFPVYAELTEIAEKIDVIVDFSHPSALDGMLEFALRTKTPAVICTTGLTPAQVEQIDRAAETIPIFYSANMSIGVSLVMDLCRRAAKTLQGGFDIEIIEKHHNQKVDAPSGTALAIADAISAELDSEPDYTYGRDVDSGKREKSEIGIHAVRGGTIVGEHSVIFAGLDEVIEIKHSAMSKEVFTAGAVRAAAFMKGKPPGFYNMKNLI